jgi:hypothetical protein
MKGPRTRNFVLFRAFESLIFAAPVFVAFFQDSLFVFLVTVFICVLLYALWTRLLKRHLTESDVESYDAVYEEPPTRVFRLSELIPWQIWLLWIGVLAYSIFFF